MKVFLEIALLLGAAISAVHASPAPTNQPQAGYRVPTSWKLLKNGGPDDKGRTVMYEVLKGVDSGDHPTVMIKIHEVPPGLHADDVDVAEVARQVVPSGVPVSDVHDGPDWRTCVFLGHVDNAKIVALYRIGLKDGQAVEEVFIFPLPSGKSEELALLTIDGQADEQGRTTGVYAPLQSTYKVISMFNDFTKTLTINGETSFHARAVMAKSTEKPTAVYRWIDSPSSSASTGG